jgi:hypothetical protein
MYAAISSSVILAGSASGWRPRGIPIENEIQSLNMSVASLARVAWFLLRREKPKPDPT